MQSLSTIVDTRPTEDEHRISLSHDGPVAGPDPLGTLQECFVLSETKGGWSAVYGFVGSPMVDFFQFEDASTRTTFKGGKLHLYLRYWRWNAGPIW